MKALKIKYNTETLKHIITDLSLLTGISIAFLDDKFNTLVRCYEDNDYCSALQKLNLLDRPCHCSDRELLNKCNNSKQPQSHICHAGLCDSAMPIIKNDIIVGYVIFGRVKTKHSPQINGYLSDKRNTEMLNALYSKLPFCTEEQIASLLDLLPRILFQNAIEIENDSFITSIVLYIDNNLHHKLDIRSICNEFYISKNRLYTVFHDYFGLPVNDYITNRRISKAKEMLKTTKEPVYKIAEEAGFDNYTYFCKLFKRKTGFTPTKYRTVSQN